MSSIEPPGSRSRPSVFLSYASEDRQAARSFREALPSYGLDPWHDENDLGGGELWDQKIRTQIRECDYFMPIISAQTEARHEGYFRREWRLAVERTLDMADDHPFLLPIVIDDTQQAGARVPEKFLAVQWLRVPGGNPTSAFAALCRRIAAHEPPGASPRSPPARTGRAAASLLPTLRYPEFPREEPGRKLQFGFQVLGWAVRSAWVSFRKLPRWARVLICVWVVIVVASNGFFLPRRHSPDISAASAEKLKEISANYQGSSHKEDISKLAKQIAREFSDDAMQGPAERSPLLAIPFTAPAGDARAERLADAAFAQVYGRLAIAHRGRVGLTQEPLPSTDLGAALERGRATHSTYVLEGNVESASAGPLLTVRIGQVADGSLLWSASYPSGSDPARIAVDVESRLPRLED